MIALAFLFTLGTVVAVTLGLRHFLTVAGRRVGERTAGLHHDLESIVETGRVPRAWIEEAKRRSRGAPLRERRLLLRRLAALRTYCRTSTMVDGPETLAVLLDGLARAERDLAEAPVPPRQP